LEKGLIVLIRSAFKGTACSRLCPGTKPRGRESSGIIGYWILLRRSVSTILFVWPPISVAHLSSCPAYPQTVALPILAPPSGPFKPHSLQLPKAASFKSLYLKRPYTASLPLIFAQGAPDTALRLPSTNLAMTGPDYLRNADRSPRTVAPPRLMSYSTRNKIPPPGASQFCSLPKGSARPEQGLTRMTLCTSGLNSMSKRKDYVK